MKKTLLLLLNFLLLPAIGQETGIVYLSGKDKDNTVEWDFLCTNGRNSNKWSRIAVPLNWELQGFGSYLYGNINMDANEKGLYRHSFRIPKDWKKKRIFIVFEGSMTDTEVKINGILAGPVHQGAFYRFKYDITDLVNLKKENLLEVTVSSNLLMRVLTGQSAFLITGYLVEFSGPFTLKPYPGSTLITWQLMRRQMAASAWMYSLRERARQQRLSARS